MNQYVRMFIFVLILGGITSILLLGMDALTAERIEANQNANLYAAILNSNDVEFTFGNINEVFEESITVKEADGLTFYIHGTSGNVSFVFLGGGVWGPIEGVLTLQSDFETIVAMKILQQEETPGLGGIIADPNYLAKYEGVSMVPEIEITHSNQGQDNQVDAITGGTRTSASVEIILNNAYADHLAAWQNISG